MKLYNPPTPEKNLQFLTYMNKLLGKDLWILIQVKNYDYGYYIQFVRTYRKEGEKETRVVTRSVYVDDLANDIQSLADTSVSKAQIFGDATYDLLLSEMTNCFIIYEPVEIKTTDDIIEMTNLE